MSILEFKETTLLWTTETQVANNLFEAGKNSAATKHYQQALYLSEIMLRSDKDASRFNLEIASPFFVSCLNIANNFWMLNDLKNASDYFFYSVWHLKMLVNKAAPEDFVHFQATKNWEKAVLALIDFHDKTNQKLTVDFWKEDTYQKITETRTWLVNKQTYLN